MALPWLTINASKKICLNFCSVLMITYQNVRDRLLILLLILT